MIKLNIFNFKIIFNFRYMKINKFKFILFLTFFFTKSFCAYLYYYFSRNLSLFDFREIYISYCEITKFSFETLNILSSGYQFFFSIFCFLDIYAYLFVFVFFQIFLIILALNRIIDFYKNLKNNNFFYFFLMFSPTILFFSSAPTKDGLIITFLCISIICNKFFSKLFLFFSILIKPYFFIFIIKKSKNFFFLLFFFLIIIFIYNNLDQIRIIFLGKIAVFNYFDVKARELIWLSELLLISLLSFKSKILNKKKLFILFCISVFAGGHNFNIGSRLFTTGVFLLITIKYIQDLKKNIRK